MKRIMIAGLATAISWVGTAYGVNEDGEQCGSPTIEQCPKLFENDCRNDKDFRLGNRDMCLEIVLGSVKQNDEFCNAIRPCPEPIDCASADTHPLAQAYCKSGLTNCPIRLQKIEEGFDRVLSDLDESLSPYNALIKLDLKNVNSKEQLCAEYTSDTLKTMRTQASEETGDIDNLVSEVEHFQSCSEGVLGFLQGEKPDDFTADIWQETIDDMSSTMKDAQVKEGAVRSRIEQLREAPKTLNSLVWFHQMRC